MKADTSENIAQASFDQKADNKSLANPTSQKNMSAPMLRYRISDRQQCRKCGYWATFECCKRIMYEHSRHKCDLLHNEFRRAAPFANINIWSKVAVLNCHRK